MQQQSPCLKCDRKDQDKNDPECVNCVLRLNYCRGLDYYIYPQTYENVKKYNAWKPQDDKVLAENYLVMSNLEMAQMINRSPSSVANRLSYLNLQRKAGMVKLMNAVKNKQREDVPSDHEEPKEEESCGNGNYLKFTLNTQHHGDLYERFIAYARSQYRTPKYQILYLIDKAVRNYERDLKTG